MRSALAPAAKLTEAQFERISALVKNLSGINLHTGKKELVKARLGKRLRLLGIDSFEDYLDRVAHDPRHGELTTMLDSLSTNLTSFFRENQHFEFLVERVLPGVLAKGAASRRRLRLWSAGCSSGEEPYSLAITLHEHMASLSAWDVGILATDLSTRVLAHAKEAVYDAARFENMPAALRSRHFDCIESKPDKRYRVKDGIRRIVHFARLNLMDPWPMSGPFDVVFCRNVMIYFDKPTQTRLVGRFWDILGPGGMLFVGHSESLAGVEHRFRYVQPTVYEKR